MSPDTVITIEFKAPKGLEDKLLDETPARDFYANARLEIESIAKFRNILYSKTKKLLDITRRHDYGAF